MDEYMAKYLERFAAKPKEVPEPGEIPDPQKFGFVVECDWIEEEGMAPRPKTIADFKIVIDKGFLRDIEENEGKTALEFIHRVRDLFKAYFFSDPERGAPEGDDWQGLIDMTGRDE